MVNTIESLLFFVTTQLAYIKKKHIYVTSINNNINVYNAIISHETWCVSGIFPADVDLETRV